jgi:hypothetical protein
VKPSFTTGYMQSVIRQVITPIAGIVAFLAETQRDEPRFLILSGCMMMMGLPAAGILDAKREKTTPAVDDSKPSADTGTGSP